MRPKSRRVSRADQAQGLRGRPPATAPRRPSARLGPGAHAARSRPGCSRGPAPTPATAGARNRISTAEPTSTCVTGRNTRAAGKTPGRDSLSVASAGQRHWKGLAIGGPEVPRAEERRGKGRVGGSKSTRSSKGGAYGGSGVWEAGRAEQPRKAGCGRLVRYSSSTFPAPGEMMAHWLKPLFLKRTWVHFPGPTRWAQSHLTVEEDLTLTPKAPAANLVPMRSCRQNTHIRKMPFLKNVQYKYHHGQPKNIKSLFTKQLIYKDKIWKLLQLCHLSSLFVYD